MRLARIISISTATCYNTQVYVGTYANRRDREISIKNDKIVQNNYKDII